jgi:hypothetical protein
MDQILSRPEIQSAVLPFIAGLLFSIGLRKLTANAWVWAVFAAFLISVYLINGLTIIPLTGTRKIILLVLASFIVAGFIYHLIPGVNRRRTATSALGVLALLWVFWKVMLRMEPSAMALFLVGGVGLVLWLVWAFDRIGGDDARLHSAGFSLLLGTGLSAAAGASALLGQLALSLSAASGGVLLAWVLMGGDASSNPSSIKCSTLPYALAAALLGLAAVIFARMPWYALILLAAIPPAIGLVPKISDTRFTSALVTSLPGLFVALAVAFWVWQTGSSSSGY